MKQSVYLLHLQQLVRIVAVLSLVFCSVSCRTTSHSMLLISDKADIEELANALREVLDIVPDPFLHLSRQLIVDSLSMTDAEFKVHVSRKAIVDQLGKEEALAFYQSIVSFSKTERIGFLKSHYLLAPNLKGHVRLNIVRDEEEKLIIKEGDPEYEDYETTPEIRAWAVQWAKKYLLKDYSKELWSQALSKVPLTKEQQLVLLSASGTALPTVPSSGTETNLLDFVADRLDMTKVVIEPHFQSTIANVTKITRAKYDNDAGTIIIPDPNDAGHVVLLTKMLVSVGIEKARNMVRSLPQNLFRDITRDTNSLEAQSRVEPFDLLKDGIKTHVQLGLNPIDLVGWEQVKKSRVADLTNVMLENFGFTNKTRSETQNIYIVRGLDQTQKSVGILCMLDNKGEQAEISVEVKYDISGEVNHYFMLSFEDGKAPPSSIEVKCGKKTYDIDLTVTSKIGTLPKPVLDVETLYKDKKLHIATSVALVNEISLDAVIGGVAYLSARGFLPYSYRWVPNIASEFKYEFVNTWDAFIPASHNHQVQGFGIGTKTALRIDFVKYISGKKVLLTVYFPPYPKGQSSTLSRVGPALWQLALMQAFSGLENTRPQTRRNDIIRLSPTEVTGLFCERRSKKRSPLVVFTVACNVTSTIHDWMSAYRNSHFDTNGNLIPIHNINDVPIVIAPDRGFNTNNSAEIIDHLEYPLTLVESIAVGDSVDRALSKLNAASPKSWLQQAVRQVSGNTDARYDYDGVANVEHDHYFNLGEELRLKLERR